jgi:hypothetical protein
MELDLDLDALQTLPGGQETSELACTWTCSARTCADTCITTG